jgi:hypothetical protein
VHNGLDIHTHARMQKQFMGRHRCHRRPTGSSSTSTPFLLRGSVSPERAFNFSSSSFVIVSSQSKKMKEEMLLHSAERKRGREMSCNLSFAVRGGLR